MPHVLAVLFAFILAPTPSPTISPLPSAIVQWYARQGAAASGLDPALVRAVIDAESGGDPHAVSKAGAVGMMQLEKATASDCGIHNRFDTLANVVCGSKTLAYLVRRYGIEEGLASYNYGAGNVGSIGGHFSKLPVETQGYVKDIILEYDELQHLTIAAMAPPAPRARAPIVANAGAWSPSLLLPLDLGATSYCTMPSIAYSFTGPSISISFTPSAENATQGLAEVDTATD